MHDAYFLISTTSSLCVASAGFDDVRCRSGVERDFTTMFSSVDEPIDAARVNDEKRY